MGGTSSVSVSNTLRDLKEERDELFHALRQSRQREKESRLYAKHRRPVSFNSYTLTTPPPSSITIYIYIYIYNRTIWEVRLPFRFRIRYEI